MRKSSTPQLRLCKSCRENTAANKLRCEHCGVWELSENHGDLNIGNGGPRKVVYMRDYKREGGALVKTTRVASGPWDGALGGGLVEGNTVIFAGQAGAGKSTLALQIIAAFPIKDSALYVSREETQAAVFARAERLRVKRDFGVIPLLENSELDVEGIIWQVKPKLIIFDSLQKYSGGDDRIEIETCEWLKRYAVKHNACPIIINHVNKDTVVAGAYALQHEVDVVLCLFPNDDKTSELYSIKSRQGPTFDVFLFRMTERGLKPVKPSKKSP